MAAVDGAPSHSAPRDESELPKALVKRIVKAKLNDVAGDGKEFQLNKDALQAFAESARVFISFLTATANDICREGKRLTVTADDVFAALEELDFGEFVPVLQEALEGFRRNSKEKRAKSAEQSKKRREAAKLAGANAALDDAGGDDDFGEDDADLPSKLPRLEFD